LRRLFRRAKPSHAIITRVELIWKHGITELEQISHLVRLSKNMAQQYIDLLPEKIRHQHDKISLASDSTKTILPSSGETEAGNAKKFNRKHGDF
jgi:hypothetical protein